MNYIWDIYLDAAKKGISNKDVSFRPAQNPSPYVEVALADLNTDFFEEAVDVNAYFRFGEIFEGLLLNDNDMNNELTKALFDVLIHYLAEVDMFQGLSKKEYYALFLQRDTRDKIYSKNNAFAHIPFEDRRILAESMVKLYMTGPSIELLRSTLSRLFPASMVYLDQVDHKKLLIYIGSEKTAALDGAVQFGLDLFIPVDYEIKLFWDMHFGMIGIDETMIIDEIMVF